MSDRNAPPPFPFQDPDRPADERIGDLLSRMTLKEKAACLGTDPGVPRLGVRGSGHVEGLHGLALGEPGDWGRPLVIPTTTFPQAIGLAMTWDPETLRRAGAIEGYEARYVFQRSWHGRGGLVVRAPNADLGRDPRWGRTEECYGEDAFFNGTMAVALIKGLQGDHPTYWLAAALIKHFLANSNEDTRESSSSDMDERLYREYYSVPFRMGVVEGGSRAYMAAYNRVNGVPCAVHPMLKEITVAEWGQDGLICTDGGAMRLLVTAHKYYPDEAHAVAAVVKAGIGQFLDDYEEGAKQALAYGLLAEADVDAALRGVFRVMLKLGLLDPPELVPYASIGTGGPPWLTEEHRLAVREATQKSIVLLKNEGAALPLDRDALRSIAVIGPLADRVLLDWYSGTPPYAVTPLAGIRDRVGAGAVVRHDVGDDHDAAAELARASDVVIVCVGNHPTGGDDAPWARVSLPSEGREAVDRRSLTLEQEGLVRRVHAANPHIVVALIASFPYAINWTQENVPAVVHLSHNSQELGGALADVLFGDYNPGGRLVQTWPSSLDQLPPLLDYDIRHGRTYMYFQGAPLYPFGFGLSYTTFAYSNLQTSADTLTADGTLTVSVDVQNTGTRTGDEVVQLYVRHINSAVERPLKELKGFQRVTLQPGETKTVILTLPASRLAYWDAARHAFTVEAGTVQITVGPSSAIAALETSIAVTA